MARVSQYTDSNSSRELLFQFYREVYPDSPWLLDEIRFKWQSLSNPLLKPDETHVWLLYDENDKIIGQNIYIRYNLKIDGSQYPGFCSTNLIVRPELVGKRLGHNLIEVNENLDGVAYAVGITPASTRAFIKRGWVLVQDARLHLSIRHPFPNLKYLGFSSWKSILLAPALKIVSIFYGLLRTIAAPKKPKGVTYRSIDQFDAEMDNIWQSFLSGFAISFNRDSRMLNHKFSSRKDVDHNILLFEKDDQPVGYCVYRLSENKVRGIKLGRIVDFVYDPDGGSSLVNYMIKVVTDKLIAMDVDGIVGISSNKEISDAMKKNGLFLSRPQASIIKETDFDIKALRDKYQDLWYITLADSDLDNYW